MIIVTKTNTGAQALRRRICGTIFVRYCLKFQSFIITSIDLSRSRGIIIIYIYIKYPAGSLFVFYDTADNTVTAARKHKGIGVTEWTLKHMYKVL